MKQLVALQMIPAFFDKMLASMHSVGFVHPAAWLKYNLWLIYLYVRLIIFHEKNMRILGIRA